NGFVGFTFAAAHGTVPGLDMALVELLLMRNHPFQLDHGQVAALAEGVVRVPDISDAAGHASGKVAAGADQHHRGAACPEHATMVAAAFHYRGSPRVAYGKTLTGYPIEERLARQRAVQHGIAGNAVVGSETPEIIGRA